MREFINYQIDERIAWMTLYRPPVNALNDVIFKELNEVLDEFAGNHEALVLVLTAKGNAFCAGADIKFVMQSDAATQKAFIKKGPLLTSRIESLDRPTICAINGFALGGGLEVAMAFDFRVASEKATFGQPEIGIGGIPGAGGTQRLPRLIGRAKAKRLIFTGETIDAKEAYRIGLVDMVVGADQLVSETNKFAKAMASRSPVALRLAKKSINEGVELPLQKGLEIEGKCFGEVQESEDHREGIRAFLEKRAPVYKGR